MTSISDLIRRVETLERTLDVPTGPEGYATEIGNLRIRCVELLQQIEELREQLKVAEGSARAWMERTLDLRNALEILLGEQNGPPLVSREKEWRAAVDQAETILNAQGAPP